MNKKYLLLICLFLLCGCSANYDLNIDDGKLTEKVTVNNVDVTKFSNAYVPINSEADDIDIFERKFDDVKYYNKSLKDESVIFSYKHNYKTIKTSTFLNSCYENVDAYVERNRFIISTTGDFSCFELYDELDSVKVSINSKYELIDTNGKKKDNYTYEWNINKNNINEGIYLELDITKKNIEKNLFDFGVFRFLFFCGVMVGCIILFLIFRFISQARDRI